MSAIEFGLTQHPSFATTLLEVPFEQALTGSEPQHRIQAELDKTNARLKLLVGLSGSPVDNEELQSFLAQLTIGLRRLMSLDFVVLGLSHFEDGRFQAMAFDAADDISLSQESIHALAEVFWEQVKSTDQSSTGESEHLDKNQAGREWMAAFSRKVCILPLVARGRVLGVLALGNREDFAPCYTQDELEYLRQVSSHATIVVENFLLYAELRKLKEESSEENVYLDEPHCESRFEEIVGRSAALQRVLSKVEIVAPTDSGVLIEGETGTGKELIAQAIHNRSDRRDRPFVKVNCAAIPSGLLESELFGHEKGAFTGAIMRKPGRFEVADKGTLFLDEVGDISLELQAKLLRVLQEHEFERLGSTRTQQVDVRVIAATHRNLKEMVEEGTFRSDLYYRLHVFPVVIPPLRDRREDIPLIVRLFVDKYARRMNRRIETIPGRTMEALTHYPWPGNVRELQNFVERAVILTSGTSLRAPLDELKQAQNSHTNLSTLEEMEREHVLRALRESNWVTGGPNGAAARLGVKRTTLAYRIRKLKIRCRPQ